MSKNKVCILRSNPVNPDSRVEKEAYTLIKAGYDVRIFSWDRTSNHCPLQEMIKVGNTSIPITRVGYKATYGEGLKNIKQYLSFQYAMRRYLRREKFDIVHACDFDTSFFTYKLVKRIGGKFIFDIFDFLCDNRKTFIQKILVTAQYKIINEADATIICTEERRTQIRGSVPRRICVVHNTPSAEQLVKPVDSITSKRMVRVCYVGILQNGRLLKEIGDFFAEHPEIEFHIGGFGYLESYFNELSSKCSNIKFYGKISYEKTLELEQSSDIMLAIYDPAIPNHKMAAPNKLYEGLLLGKPLIMAKGTGMSFVVEENSIGEMIDYSKEGFSNGLNKLIARKAEWHSIGIKMQQIYIKDYNWEEMAKRLCNLYEELMEQ